MLFLCINQDQVKAIINNVMFCLGFYAQIQEDPAMQAGFIGFGGLLGLTIGALRGRFFKKLFYTTLGAGGATAICYPNETKALADEAKVEGEKLGQIAYNFINGGNYQYPFHKL